VITNDVCDYINLLVRIARIICNHRVYLFAEEIEACAESDRRPVLGWELVERVLMTIKCN